MLIPIVLALASVVCFFGLAHMVVTTPPAVFRAATRVMMGVSLLLALVAPTAGIALFAPVVFARRLSGPFVPATVPARIVRRHRG